MTALDCARQNIGVHEDPAGSNDQKFGSWYGENGVSWCSIFIAFCLYFGGAYDVRAHVAKNYAWCPDALAGFAKLGWTVNVQNIQPGDIVFYHFSGEHAGANHTGIVEKVNRSWFGLGPVTSIVAIEGNTSGGSNANGGIVQRRTRSVGLIVGVGRLQTAALPPKIVLTGTTVSATPAALNTWQLLALGIANAKQQTLMVGSTGDAVKFLQHGLNASKMPDGRTGVWFGQTILLIEEDGVFGERTKDCLRVFQVIHGLADDGICGPLTWTRLYA